MAQSEKIKYSVVEGWEQLPKGYVHRDVTDDGQHTVRQFTPEDCHTFQKFSLGL